MAQLIKENIGLVIPLQGATATITIGQQTYIRKVGLGEFYWDFGDNKIMQLPNFWLLTYKVEGTEEVLIEQEGVLFAPVLFPTPQLDNKEGEYDELMADFEPIKQAIFQAIGNIVLTMEQKGRFEV